MATILSVLEIFTDISRFKDECHLQQHDSKQYQLLLYFTRNKISKKNNKRHATFIKLEVALTETYLYIYFKQA
jgi:hypothetical protein